MENAGCKGEIIFKIEIIMHKEQIVERKETSIGEFNAHKVSN